MADCCGGKNAGKPISLPRYLAGLGVFFAYHGTICATLHVAAIPMKRLRKVRDFHRQLFFQEGMEVLRREDIHVGKSETPVDEACPVSPINEAEEPESPKEKVANLD
jgi:hypothetical protein